MEQAEPACEVSKYKNGLYLTQGTAFFIGRNTTRQGTNLKRAIRYGLLSLLSVYVFLALENNIETQSQWLENTNADSRMRVCI